MTISRRYLLQFGAAAVVGAVPRRAWSQAYPSRPVRLVVGFPAGGTADISARLIAQYLSGRLGYPVVVENRPGAVGNIATEMVVRAAPDGYTLLLVVSANATNAALYRNLKFDFLRDIAPIASMSAVRGVMAVHPSVSATTVAEFIAGAKARPGKINMGSGGVGSSSHLFGEMFKMLASVDLVPVHYHGDAPALTGLVAGQVEVMFPLLPTALEQIRAGHLHALAVTSAARAPELPDVPAIGESLPGYEAGVWNGIGAPKGTPHEIVERLNQEVNSILRDRRLLEKFAELGLSALGGSPAAFGQLIAVETKKWAAVIEFAGAKAE